MLVKVDFPAFVGAMTAKAKKDVRYYLEGLFIDPRGYLVATDDHRLFCSVPPWPKGRAPTSSG